MQQQFSEPEPSAHRSPISGPETRTENENTAEQELAAEESQSEAVTALLAATQRKIRRRKRRFWGAFALTEGTIALFLVGMQMLRHTDNDKAFVILLLLLPVALVALVVMIRTMQSPLDFDLEELERVGGARAIGPLLDSMLSGRSPGSRKIAYQALTRILPKLRATDANLLNAGHQRMLNRFLNIETYPGWWGPKPTPPPLALAILKAYEQVGDAKAVPAVEKLANLKPRNERQRAAQQAAAECLPLLHSHAMPLDQNQTLLRAAGQSKAAADVLLRPAAETLNVPVEELLRAAPSEIETTP